MKRLLALTALFVGTLGVSSTFAQLKATMTASAESPDKPVIVGHTNLPDGTELMITISRSASAFSAQDSTHVLNGAFRAGPFSNDGASLSPGVYKVEISSPLAALQSASVQTIIGKDGSKLTGPLAKRSEFGGKVIEYRTSFKVGSGVSSPEQDAAARAQEKKNLHAWWLQSCTDICNISKGVAVKQGNKFDSKGCFSKCLTEEPQK